MTDTARRIAEQCWRDGRGIRETQLAIARRCGETVSRARIRRIFVSLSCGLQPD